MSWTVYLSGEIHTDFFKKFIRAEVVHYDAFIADCSFAKAIDNCHWRLEGNENI